MSLQDLKITLTESMDWLSEYPNGIVISFLLLTIAYICSVLK